MVDAAEFHLRSIAPNRLRQVGRIGAPHTWKSDFPDLRAVVDDHTWTHSFASGHGVDRKHTALRARFSNQGHRFGLFARSVLVKIRPLDRQRLHPRFLAVCTAISPIMNKR